MAEEIVEELFYVLWKDREQLQIFQSVKTTSTGRHVISQFNTVSMKRSKSGIESLC